MTKQEFLELPPQEISEMVKLNAERKQRVEEHFYNENNTDEEFFELAAPIYLEQAIEDGIVVESLKQKYNIGDIVKTYFEDEDEYDVRIGKVVSVGICETNVTKLCYGVSYNLYGTKEDMVLIDKGDNDGNYISWIIGKVRIIP